MSKLDYSSFTTDKEKISLLAATVSGKLTSGTAGEVREFTAIVLSTIGEPYEASFFVRAKIVGDKNNKPLPAIENPHSFLPDVCNIVNAEDANNVVALTKMYTKFYALNPLSGLSEPVSVGDIIRVSMTRDSDGFMITERGSILSVLTKAPNVIKRDFKCDSVQALFDNVGSLNLPVELDPILPINTPSDVSEFSERYDADDTIEEKDKHAKYLKICHPEVIPYFKAFIYRAWSEKQAHISINSTYRDLPEQKRLFNKWINGTKEYQETHAKPVKPGSSYHNVGLAMDFNPTISGKTIMRADDVTTWEASGIPAIARSVGLRWGGAFGNNYDPIHVDLGSRVNNQSKLKMLADASEQNVAANRVEIT